VAHCFFAKHPNSYYLGIIKLDELSSILMDMSV